MSNRADKWVAANIPPPDKYLDGCRYTHVNTLKSSGLDEFKKEELQELADLWEAELIRHIKKRRKDYALADKKRLIYFCKLAANTKGKM